MCVEVTDTGCSLGDRTKEVGSELLSTISGVNREVSPSESQKEKLSDDVVTYNWDAFMLLIINLYTIIKYYFYLFAL